MGYVCLLAVVGVQHLSLLLVEPLTIASFQSKLSPYCLVLLLNDLLHLRLPSTLQFLLLPQ